VAFVQKILVPAGLHIGPKYTLTYDQDSGTWLIEDIGDDGPDDGTDEDFIELRKRPGATETG
jgi:hypothetical protein